MVFGFIGAGKLAAAIARGVVGARLCGPAEVLATARTDRSREVFAAAAGIPAGAVRPAGENATVAAGSDVLFLCVKPADSVAVLRDLAPALRANTLVISVAAGVSLPVLQSAAGLGVPLVRAMPNTPALVGRGATAYALGAAATEAHAALAETVFRALGDAHRVEEKLLDAVNGLSGCGPAYVYTFIEALADGGVLMGLPRPLAHALAVQTVLGAAEMVRQTGEHPAALRDAVTSPGGTTMAGLEALENGALRATLLATVRAATERARAMGRGEAS